jgi:hypothetical protein
MKMSQLSGNFSLHCPPMGYLKWKVNPITGSGLELVDSSGTKLAKFKSAGFPGLGGEKRLEILVPCDGWFLELALLSGIAAKAIKKNLEEIASEVAQAVAGI